MTLEQQLADFERMVVKGCPCAATDIKFVQCIAYMREHLHEQEMQELVRECRAIMQSAGGGDMELMEAAAMFTLVINIQQ